MKPANIKLANNDAVKVLDCGLAKALEGDLASTDISSSPTISRMATQAGIILGTAAYMSPEQAKGKSVDRRTDIWAFGCVLYEMLTGKMAFSGETVTDTLAAVIKSEPDWTQLPTATPPRIRELITRCLKKDAKQRLQSIGDARIAIDEILSGVSQDSPSSTAVAAPIIPAPLWRRALPWCVAGGLAIALALALVGYVRRAPRPARAIVSEIPSPANTNFAFDGDVSCPPVISPGGQRLAFSAIGSDGKQLLWVRQLGSATAQPLEGTEGATYPFWSPDGRYLGFFANGKLNRINASGGPSLAIADAAHGRGGSWGQDGTILFSPDMSNTIYSVSAAGGTPQPVTKLNASLQEITHRWPQFLPEGKHFLFYAHGDDPQNNATYIGSLDGRAPKLLVRGDSNAAYASPGYLLFVRQGTLMAQRFDAGSLRLIGEAMPLAEHAVVNSSIWRGVFGVSENGLLVYQVGNAVGDNGQLLWFDRSGKQIGEAGTLGIFVTPSLSPDGRKLAVSIADQGTSSFNVWVFDLARGIKTRLTFSSAVDAAPSWSPDGKAIAFQSNRSGQFHLYQKAADGTGSTSPLLVDKAAEFLPSLSSDARYLVFQRESAQLGSHIEIWPLPLFGDRKAFPVVQNQHFDVSEPVLSPDGKWLVYTS